MLLLTLVGCGDRFFTNAPSPEVSLADTLYVLEDAEGALAPAQALKQTLATGQSLTSAPSLGFRQTPHWFVTSATNISDEAQRRYLVAARPHTDYLDLHVFDSDEQLLASLQHGDRVARDVRPFPDNELIFPVTLPPRETVWLLMRVETSGSVELPLRLLDQQELVSYKSARRTFAGLYFGAIVSMCLFNLLLFFAIRDNSYLLYSLYLVGLTLFLFCRSGLGYQLAWPDHPWLNDPLRASSALFGEGFVLLFSVSFMRLDHSYPRIGRTMKGLALLLLAAAALSPLVDPQYSLLAATAAAGVMVPIVLVPTALRIRDGFKPARYFLLSFMPLALLAPLFVLKTFNLIQSNWVIDHAFEIGSTLEAWLLSFALAYRLTMLKAENERIQRNATVELEKRVSERTEELNRALNARSEFLAVMSHEIRTPLNGILGTVDMLKDSALNAEQRRQMHVIEQSGNTLVELINDILDYARIEAGKLPIEQEQFNLPGLIRESVALFEHRARINGDRLDIRLEQNLGLLCQGDSVRLRQILVNLVSNAVKFTEGGRVEVRAQRDSANPAYVLFEIRDTGIGISTSQKEHLFELFQQGDSSTRRRYGGTGLGLAICRQLVELMGGEIGVESRHGEGSRFWFRLPLPELTQEQRLQRREDEAIGGAPAARLLIVDDNHVNLLVAQGLAKKLGHDVEVAESGPEALAVLLNDSRPFDLILMDCEMPGMDGFETAREIIRLQSEGKVEAIPIVALTAHAVPDKIRLSHEAGMVSHIAKPINSEKLDREIRAVLRNPDTGASRSDRSA